MPTRIGVAIRVRPQLESEKQKNFTCNKLSVNHNTNSIKIQIDEKTTKTFKFDKVLDEQSTQQDIFEKNSIDQLVQKVIEGYHSTIFAYGQTGSGKTYSMEGFDYEKNVSTIKKKQTLKPILNFENQDDKQGIIPRTLQSLFEKINTANNKNVRIYRIYISYLQIYNERIYDLLNASQMKKNDGPGLRLRWNKKEQFQVENLFVFECANLNEAQALIGKGIQNKVMASHKLNAQSSRSHCILTMKVESISKSDPDNIISAKLHIVDLAGSERQSQTGTEGQNFKECIEINKSLFTLRQVINTLAEQPIQTQQDSSPKNSNHLHVPYRDSKLTSLLKQSIGGNSYCLMIACLSPCDAYLEENISTLNYATKASQISNHPIKNEDPKNKLIKELKAKVEELTKDLALANEHIAFISQFSTENINKYGPDILNMQKIKASVNSDQNDKEDILKSIKLATNIKVSENKNEESKEDKYNSIKDKLEENLNYTNIQPIVQRSLNKINNTLSLDGGLMSSDMVIRRLVESANMVRDLLQSNINMRDMVEKLTKSNETIESEFNILSIENSDLREKNAIMENILAQDKINIEDQEDNNNKSSLKMTNGFLKSNLTQTNDFEMSNITRQEIVNEIHQLRKEKKNLCERLKALEIENTELNTKLNPNSLYGEPARMHLNQTVDANISNQQQQVMYHSNQKPNKTKLKKSQLGSRVSAKSSMNVIDEMSLPESLNQTNQQNSLISTQQNFSTLYQSKLNFNHNQQTNNANQKIYNQNQPINGFNQTMYYNNTLFKRQSCVTESPEEFPYQMKQQQLYSRARSSSKQDQNENQQNRAPSRSIPNAQNNSYNTVDSGFIDKHENHKADYTQYSNFGRNSPSCFNQVQSKLYETSAIGWINTTPIIYQNSIRNPGNQYLNDCSNYLDNFSCLSKKKNVRTLSQNSKRPPTIRQHFNLLKNC